MKTQFPDRGQVAHRAVGHIAHTSQRHGDVRLNLADERTKSWHAFDVLKNYDARLRPAGDVPPEIDPIVVAAARQRRRGSPDSPGYRVSQHGRKVLEAAAHRAGREPFVPQSNAESFDRVRNRARVQRSYSFEFGPRR